MTETNEPEEVVEEPEQAAGLFRFKRSGPNWDLNILDAEIDNGRKDLTRYRDSIDEVLASIKADKRSPRLAEFKEAYTDGRILEMPILNETVEKGDRGGATLEYRTKLRQILNSIPEA